MDERDNKCACCPLSIQDRALNLRKGLTFHVLVCYTEQAYESRLFFCV